MCYPVILRDADWARVAIAPGWRPDNNKYDVINNYLFPFPIYFVCALVGGMSDDASYVYWITSETSMWYLQDFDTVFVKKNVVH